MYKKQIFATILQKIFLALFTVSIFTFLHILPGDAQNRENWTQHINLSNSGGAINPQIILDSEGTFHAFWEDIYAGYVHTYSNDGVDWSQPHVLDGPFSRSIGIDTLSGSPFFFSDNNGHIHVFWKENTDLFDNVLFYSRIAADNLQAGEFWENTQRLGTSVLGFDIDIDVEGVLHLAYLVSGDENQGQAGIYYIHTLDNQYYWTSPLILYQSQYFRSLAENSSSNIDIAVSTNNGSENIFLTWDNRPRERIFFAKSDDGGNTWNDTIEIAQPDETNPSEIPFNIQVAASGPDVLLLWQVGQPEGGCEQYYQVSNNQGTTWGEPKIMLSDISGCPNENTVLVAENGLILLLATIQNQSYMLAWDGNRWSEAQPQLSLSNFEDPETFNELELGCQQTIITGDQVFTIGCDSPESGDIWLTNRSIGDISDWFPPQPLWSQPTIIASNETDPISPVAISDTEGRVHVFWSTRAANSQVDFPTEILYAVWTDERWSYPTAVIVSQEGKVDHPAIATDNSGRVLMVWSGGESREIYFSWASAAKAMITTEWSDPLILPSILPGGSKPDIIVDHTGAIHVAYSIPLNEARGVYLTSSTDGGSTWSDPIYIFDGAQAEWDMLDDVHLTQTGNNDLHVLWTRYTLPGGTGSKALYYARSADGGQSWSEPESVDENPIEWSEITGVGENTVHRFWVERRGGLHLLWHQVSQDNGINWENTNNISTLNAELISASTAADPVGNIHLVELIKEYEGRYSIHHSTWLDQRWTTEEGLDIGTDFIAVAERIDAAVSPEGYLAVLYPGIRLAEDTENLENYLFFTTQSFELEEINRSIVLPTPTPNYIPTPLSTEEQLFRSTSTPTATPNIQSINQAGSDSRKANNNPWAGLAIGSILGAVVFAIILGLILFRNRKK